VDNPMKPTMHSFWVMLVFAVSLAAFKAAFSSALLRFGQSVGEVAASIALIVPAWFWLQFIAHTIKAKCPRCGESQLRFTGRFPLTRTFHCDACGLDHEVIRPGGGADD